MEWAPVHQKSKKLETRSTDFVADNKDTSRVFVYTDEGFRKDGDWYTTGVPWTKGSCIVEFKRVCEDNTKAFDLESGNSGILFITIAIGRWNQRGGECIDHVLRGCYNNGTCVKPNTCECAPGWK
eukprot:3564685-Ditylum_brightwellii.AAC.1